MHNYFEFASQIALLEDHELLDLANRCKSLYTDRERIRRNELKPKLMENLQKAIGDILDNGFTLTIQNDERDCHDDYGCVIFSPDETYSIEIE